MLEYENSNPLGNFDDATVYVIDDDPEILDSIRSVMEISRLRVKTYTDPELFLTEFDGSGPSCVVLDYKMPGMSGVELQKRLQQRGMATPIIFISGFGSINNAVLAMKSGAVDYLTKPFPPEQLVESVKDLLRDEKNRFQVKQHGEILRERYASLTPRETQVFECLVKGMAGKQIARELKISYRTLEKFRAGLMRKMQAEGIAELVLMAFQLNLLDLEFFHPE